MSRRFRQLESVDEMLPKRRRSASGTSESSNTSKEESFAIPVKNKNISEQVKSKWTNRERVLIFCSRGASYRMRHLMKDFLNLMPHSKSDNKLDKKKSLVLINEIAEIANCTKCLYFESRKHTDLYLWISNTTCGPSVKFLAHNVHTMDEMRMSGNCLKGSRPVLSFDSAFDNQPHFSLIKQLLIQTFSTPYHHPRSKPFIDHVFTFSITADGKIWFRNFQIVNETLELQEIGPRMVLEIIRIFDGSFEGSVLYDNPNYVSPNTVRSEIKKKQSNKYIMKKLVEEARGVKLAEQAAVKMPDPVGEVFDTERMIVNPRAKEIKRIIEKKKKKKTKSKTRKIETAS
ncbi:brix domain-containing protein [Loa loa]|uniref:Ribosome biogenesis protein BRX1 homolog n=1 Tax=Loa loa TaxID=7209 RepID=A0A1I7W361_LOALO|nr:brix domain-containing protein [Loa loa]EFO27670.1 brix domain-containing protein [Loa loa]